MADTADHPNLRSQFVTSNPRLFFGELKHEVFWEATRVALDCLIESFSCYAIERSQVSVAFIVIRPNAQPSVDEIRQFTLSNGPAYQHPRRIAFIAELPWASTNKIDRRALIERARALEAARGWSQ